MPKVDIKGAKQTQINAWIPIYEEIERTVQERLDNFNLDQTLSYFVEDRKVQFGDSFEFISEKGESFIIKDRNLHVPLNQFFNDNFAFMQPSHLDKEGFLDTDVIADVVEREIRNILIANMIELIRGLEDNLEKRIKFVIGKRLPIIHEGVAGEPTLIVQFAVGVEGQ